MSNFMCVSNAELDFENTDAIVLQGGNGQGKSTVLECIALCLSENKRGLKYNDYVKIGSQEAKVELKCLLNGEPLNFYVTLHYEKGAAFERLVEYKDKKYANSEVTTLIKDLELDFYSNILFTMQHEEPVSEMSPSWRSRYLQKLFQFDFTSQSDTLRQEINELEQSIKEKEQQINFYEKSISEKKSLITSVPVPKLSKKDYDTKVEKVAELKKYVQDNLQEDTTSSILSRMNDLKLKISSIKQADSSNRERLSQIEEYKSSLESLEIPEKVSDYVEGRRDDEIDELNKKIQSDRESIDALSKKTIDLDVQYNILIKKKDLLEKGFCPTCGQKTDALLSQDELSSIDSLIEEKNSITSQIENTRKDIRDCTEKISSIKEEENNRKYRINMAKMKWETAKKKETELSEKIKKLESLVVETEIDKVPSLEEELKSLETVYNSSVAEKKKMTENYTLLSQLENEVAEYNNTLLDSYRVNQSNSVLSEKIKKDEENKSLTESERVQNVRDLGYSNEAYKIITQSLPNFLIIKTCALIEAEMNSFMQTVFPTWRVFLQQNKSGSGVDFLYTKNLDLDLTKKSNLRNVKMASGFEKSLLSIAFKVALTKAYNLSFAVLDEIDSDADDENSEKMFEQLIESNIFDQLFIITHKSGTRSFIKNAAKSAKFYLVENGKFSEFEGDD